MTSGDINHSRWRPKKTRAINTRESEWVCVCVYLPSAKLDETSQIFSISSIRLLSLKMTNSAAAVTTTQESPQIPDQLLPQVLDYLNGFVNTSIDFSKPNLNPYFAHVYLVFVGVYGLLIFLSVLLNFGMVYHVYRRQLHDEPTCAFLVNVALANVLTVSFVLPITLAVLLIRNWIFGQTICLVLPLLQVWSIGLNLFGVCIEWGITGRLHQSTRFYLLKRLINHGTEVSLIIHEDK